MSKSHIPVSLFLGSFLLAVVLSTLSMASSPVSPTNLTAHASTSHVKDLESIIVPVKIIVDDFEPQHYQSESVYFYNRLDGDRGALNDAAVTWGRGNVSVTISTDRSWGGLWLSLNHPISERQPINFSGLFSDVIQPDFQSQITTVTIDIADGTAGRPLRLELKNNGVIAWQSDNTILVSGQQSLDYALPALDNVNELVIVLDNATIDDYVVIEELSFEATTQITDTATAAFVWSYGMLLHNWNPTTGLIRDNAKFPSGVFEAVQSTGSLAAATALAYQLGVIEKDEAVTIVNTISDTLLSDLPRYQGLWPHWVISTTDTITIVQNTEWSSVDTTIAAIGLLDAQVALDLDTTGTISLLQGIAWDELRQPTGISHGYHYDRSLITSTWDVFGGESWLVALAYAAAEGEVPPLAHPLPPTANGSGFIDELAWLYVPPPSVPDVWGVNWPHYRATVALSQTTYYTPTTCFEQLGLFGLSAAEIPQPSLVSETQIYQPFGMGGQFAPPHDGSDLLGDPVVVPHYSAMIASLRPTDAISMWQWLINEGPFSPLNNVESLSFPAGSACTADEANWNQLKGSWNLALQTLGWGLHLAQQNGGFPIIWQATRENAFLRQGYLLLVPPKGYLPLILNE